MNLDMTQWPPLPKDTTVKSTKGKDALEREAFKKEINT